MLVSSRKLGHPRQAGKINLKNVSVSKLNLHGVDNLDCCKLQLLANYFNGKLAESTFTRAFEKEAKDLLKKFLEDNPGYEFTKLGPKFEGTTPKPRKSPQSSQNGPSAATSKKKTTPKTKSEKKPLKVKNSKRSVKAA